MDVSNALETFVEKSMFLALNDGVWDFTLPDDQKIKAKKKPSLLLGNEQLTIDYPLPFETKKFRSCMSSLCRYLGCGDPLIGWGVKDLFTYNLGKTGFKLNISRSILDIKILESFMGLQNASPKTYKEAASRLGRVVRYSKWDQLKNIYKEIYLPLIKEVLPSIETTGLERGKKSVYPHYEIEGQVNGRLKGSKKFHDGFNPHGIAKNDLHNYGFGHHDDFLCLHFDYQSLEVRVLQWLSRDRSLSEILEKGGDAYKIIWKRITSIKCTPFFREICKSIFLPIVYGLGSTTLAEKLKVTEPVAKQLIDNVYREFPDAMSWIEEQQNSNDYDGYVYDYFGRRRRFKPREHRIRSFVVQAPASTICLHKLVRLFYSLKGKAKIVYHVHDGYIVTTDRKHKKAVLKICKKSLQSKNELYPGLDLKVATQTGERLHKLEKI